MADRSADLSIDASGAITTKPETRSRLRACTGGYHVAVDAPGLVVLCGEGRDGERVRMAGEIVSSATVLEVINVVASTHWHGRLTVAPAAGPARTLAFDQGALKAVESTHPGDRLAEVLHRSGRVDRPTARALAAETADDRHLAAHCVERGLLDADGLFAALRRQAEDVFYGALLVAEGVYVFRAGEAADDHAGAAGTLHLPVQALLMEGVQRIDEMALFRERIPSADLVPEPRPEARLRGSQEPRLARILTLADGERSISDIARLTGLGEFGATKAVYQLLQQGAVVLRSPRRLDQAAVHRLVGQVNDVMRDVFMAVATYGGIDQTRATLSAWMNGSGHASLLGDMVDVDGSLSSDDVLARLSRVDGDHPVELLHQALHELAAFALFAATTSLPRGQELTLSRDVNRRLQAIRL